MVWFLWEKLEIIEYSFVEYFGFNEKAWKIISILSKDRGIKIIEIIKIEELFTNLYFQYNLCDIEWKKIFF